jgi:hypothetical protein
VDDNDGDIASVAILQSDVITGPYKLLSIIRPGGLMSGDIGAYVFDGVGYLIFAKSGFGLINNEIAIARLTADYT